MKRTNSKTRRRKYPKRPPTPTDAGALIARRAIVRALRRAGMHHVLKGATATIGFVFPPSIAKNWARNAAMDLLRELTLSRHAYHDFYDSSIGRRRDGNAPGGTAEIIKSDLFFGFASNENHFPEDFRTLADHIVTLKDLDAEAIKVAFRAIMNVDASPDIIDAALHLPDGMISGVIKRKRRLQDVIRTLTRPHNETKPGPSLPTIDDLSGYGEVAVWAKALMADLKAYKNGEIEWQDVDRGAVISGPSGTGKTLFAQVLAASCDVPLHAHSLMQWQAKGHLGDLLGAMRKAFDKAAASAPCILFLDEVDSFGSRGSFSAQNEHYCSEVVNGLLECLDGVGKRAGVVVIGATNLPERIDPALLRPGRMGRHLRVELPDAQARIGILRHHLGDAMPGIDLADVASRLDGASGAVIEQVVRDARRRARTANRKIEPSDLATSLPPRVRLEDAAFERTCIHEAGHAIVGYDLRIEAGATPVEVKVTREVDPAGGESGSTTFDHQRGTDRTRQTYEASIATALAGIAAENVLLGTHGASGGGSAGCDLHRATVLAAGLVVSYGLDGRLVWLGFATPEQVLGHLRSDARLSRRVDDILHECLARAKAILLEKKDRLLAMATLLAERRHLDASDIVRVLTQSNSGLADMFGP